MFPFIVDEFNTNFAFSVYVYVLVGLLGLVIGSFLNVVGLRFLSGESIVFPASKCPKCQTKLKWYDNIPVLAYTLLLGKCRYCKEKISFQYPLVEAITAIMFLLVFATFGFSWTTLMLWILVSPCIVMCITDFREQIIFDATSIPFIAIGLIYSFFNLGNLPVEKIPVFNFGFSINSTFIDAIIAIGVAFLFFEIISLIAKLTIKNRAFGEGDTIIAMMFGAWFGLKATLLIIAISFLVQAVFTLPVLVINLCKQKDNVASLSFIALILSAVSPLILTRFDFFYTAIGSLLLIVATLSVAVISALLFLKRMKELEAFTMLPFGPALIVAGFIVLFLGEQIFKYLGI